MQNIENFLYTNQNENNGETNTNIVFPDYSDCIVNFSSSILNHYGVKCEHETLSKVDEILAKNFTHVVVILLDGLGMDTMEKNLYFRDFLRRNLLTDYSSVYPPTTTASTTSFLSGKYPIEHGWLGWDLYFEQEDKTVTCFSNTLQNTTEKAASYDIAQKYLPYEDIFQKINNANNAKAYGVFPFDAFGFTGHKEIDDWVKEVRRTINSKERTFTYAYLSSPDGVLHKSGGGSRDVEAEIRKINNIIIDLCQSAKDTVFFITADHGHINIENEFLCETYPEIANMMERPLSIEPRAISFYVKKKYKKEFPEIFNKYFGEHYMLFSKEEVLKNNLFGKGRAHENLTGIGDFIGVAIGEKTLLWNKECRQFRSHHAGMTKKEMRIPLICYQTRKRMKWTTIYYGVIALVVAFLAYIYFM